MKKSLKTLLGFTPIESILWDKLTTTLSVSDLARSSGVPRTTIYTSLDTLRDRGLIHIRKKGRLSLITPLSTDDVYKRISNEITKNETDNEYSIRLSENNNFRIIHGLKSMLNLWDEIVSLSKNGRVLAIQPTKSLVTLIKKQEAGYFVPLNERIKENNIIFETVIREDTIPTYIDIYKGQPEIQKQVIKSLIGRSSDSILVENSYLNIDSDLIITPQSAFILNWDSEVGIEIQNKDMINLLRELFTLARGYGKKIDQTKYLMDILENIR